VFCVCVSVGGSNKIVTHIDIIAGLNSTTTKTTIMIFIFIPKIEMEDGNCVYVFVCECGV